MKDINDLIESVTTSTRFKERIVEKVIRSMFADIQEFANKKKGVCVQIPYVGTFRFRANAIPKYAENQKTHLSYWIQRLFIGETRQQIKVVTIARANIQMKFYNLRQVAIVKKEYLELHGKYKPKTCIYLSGEHETDVECMDEYIDILCKELFMEETSPFPPDDLQPLPPPGILQVYLEDP